MHPNKVWGQHVREFPQGAGQWSHTEKMWHINVLELEAVRLAILSYTRFREVSSIHLRVDNMTALSYLLNMGGIHSGQLIKISKQIWSYLLEKPICLTAEYVPSIDNYLADWESRNFQDSSDGNFVQCNPK